MRVSDEGARVLIAMPRNRSMIPGPVHRQFVYPNPGQREAMCHNDSPLHLRIR